MRLGGASHGGPVRVGGEMHADGQRFPYGFPECSLWRIGRALACRIRVSAMLSRSNGRSQWPKPPQ